jgi:hypothetical protein
MYETALRVCIRKCLFAEFTRFINDQDETMLFVCRVHKIKNFVSGTVYRAKSQKDQELAGNQRA